MEPQHPEANETRTGWFRRTISVIIRFTSITSVEDNPAIYLPGSSCVINGQTFSPCSSTANTIQRRLLSLINPTQGQYFGNIIEANAGGTRHYEALVISSQLRRSNGVTVLANYTWSHCIGTGVVPSFSGQASVHSRPERGARELPVRQAA